MARATASLIPSPTIAIFFPCDLEFVDDVGLLSGSDACMDALDTEFGSDPSTGSEAVAGEEYCRRAFWACSVDGVVGVGFDGVGEGEHSDEGPIAGDESDGVAMVVGVWRARKRPG